ncbi:hypothetical protein [Shewanella youngdeokensis]|uniref:DUF4376 domain-containing protein n=1 Tax=Shewanella youngdeokensis TaxID=2999068 RepID=A0ABZ0K0P2_9GAMM|nr:hypothetical protein RGE70_01725 [Shewanella sp. DAU334]
MYNSSTKPVWYGELRTSRGNTVVIHDKQFPEASAGRVYLYNTTRDNIIEYAEEIVQVNLHELSGEALAAAKATYSAAWNVAREAFMAQHSGWVEAHNPTSCVPKKPKPEPAFEAEPEAEAEVESAESSDYESSWPNEDFED